MNKASNTEKNEASTAGASESGATKKATKSRKAKKTESAAGVPEKQKDTKTVQGNNLDESINKTMDLQKEAKNSDYKAQNKEFALLLGSLLYSDLFVSIEFDNDSIPYDLRKRAIKAVYEPISHWRKFFNGSSDQSYEKLLMELKETLCKFWSVDEIQNNKKKNFKQQIIRLINNFNYSDCLMFLEFAANRVFINKSNEILKLDMWDTSGYAKVKYNPKWVEDKTDETLSRLGFTKEEEPYFHVVEIYDYFGKPIENKIYKKYEFEDYLPFNPLLEPEKSLYHGEFFNNFIPPITYNRPKYYDQETKTMKADPTMEKLFECFDKHLDLLVGNEAVKKQWLLQYIAHLIQKPAEKPCLYLIFRSDGGTGKSIVSDILTGLNGEHNSVTANNTEQLNGTFNDITVNRTLIIFEEVDHIKKVENTVKAITGAQGRLLTNEKNKKASKTRVFTRIMFFTNKGTSYNPDICDRRTVFFDSAVEQHEVATFFAEYSKLYRSNKAEFIDYLREYLTFMIDISGFNAFLLPEFMTETKRLAVLEQPSGIEECIASGSYAFCLWFEEIPMALNRREKVNEMDYTNFMNVRNEIEEILKQNLYNVVVVDEAYVDFGAESCVPLIREYDNLLVTQTFSKSRSMAGARLGMGIGNPELIRDLNTIKFSLNPYNVNSMTAAAGTATLKHDEYNMKNCELIMETRSWSERALRELGFEMTTSQTNFLFARHPAISGLDLYLELKRKGFLIRHFNRERIRDYNRITIGTPEQMEKLVAAIKQILADRKA